MLKKRIKELTISRDLWKEKYYQLKHSGSLSGSLNDRKAKHHSYPLVIVWFVLYLQSYGTMSLRCCQKSISGMLLVLGLQGTTPSISSIRNWCCKLGYYRIHHKDDSSGSWVLIVDESIGLNREKILLVLGVQVEDLPKKESLSLDKLTVIRLEIHRKWKVDEITDLLEGIKKERQIAYVLSDQDHSLKKSYSNASLDYVSDCTHRITAILKNLYKKDETFLAFVSLAGRLRQRWNLSGHTAYSPPNQRAKCRFANVFPVIEWAEQVLHLWKKLPEEIKEKTEWLQENRRFIEELVILKNWGKSILTQLKQGGYTVDKHQNILKMLRGKHTGKRLKFQKKVLEYLEELKLYLSQNGYTNLYCCSDVIESTFGKFKYKINKNATTGLTEFVLTIANFMGDFSIDEIQKGLEKTRMNDLYKWKKQRKKQKSIRKQKQEIFGKKRGKKSP